MVTRDFRKLEADNISLSDVVTKIKKVRDHISLLTRRNRTKSAMKTSQSVI